jgi:hypothetical protein
VWRLVFCSAFFIPSMGLTTMNEPEKSDPENLWTRGTLLQMIFLAIAGVAFLVALVALVSNNLVR